jgi:DNA-binding response OmpR family regulator
MSRILVIEDEPAVLVTLRALLEDEGYDVLEAPDGEEALEHAADSFDLALCDLRLPGMHGLEVCRRIRYRSDVPIIIVTAQVDSHDVVAGLEAGADDYVTKPFVAKELAARIRAALRRVQGTDSPPAAATPRRFRDLEIWPESGSVTKHGREVGLTATEFRLLRELVDNAGLLLSREQLLERVWGYDYLGDSRVVDAHVRRLRAKLEDDPSNPEYIVTVRGLGYRFER